VTATLNHDTPVPLFASLLDEHCTALAADPAPNLDVLRGALAAGLRVGRVAAIATNMAHLRDELDSDLDGLRAHCALNLWRLRALRAYYERLEVDHARYLWAYYTPDLTLADVVDRCAGIFAEHAYLISNLDPLADAHLIPGVRLDAARQAEAALQGWTDRHTHQGATA
jgi:hypothetical protein